VILNLKFVSRTISWVPVHPTTNNLTPTTLLHSTRIGDSETSGHEALHPLLSRIAFDSFQSEKKSNTAKMRVTALFVSCLVALAVAAPEMTMEKRTERIVCVGARLPTDSIPLGAVRRHRTLLTHALAVAVQRGYVRGTSLLRQRHLLAVDFLVDSTREGTAIHFD
jgi:hypothetical protein